MKKQALLRGLVFSASERRRERVRADTPFGLVQLGDGRHVLCIQRKVEDIGIFGAQYYATIHQLTAHGQTYGNQDGQILGAPETIINMTARVENAMRE